MFNSVDEAARSPKLVKVALGLYQDDVLRDVLKALRNLDPTEPASLDRWRSLRDRLACAVVARLCAPDPADRCGR